MFVRSLRVEEHLRVVLAYLETMTHIAGSIIEPVGVPLFDTEAEFANWVVGVVDNATPHVRAIHRVLPAECANLDAPFAGRTR